MEYTRQVSSVLSARDHHFYSQLAFVREVGARLLFAWDRRLLNENTCVFMYFCFGGVQIMNHRRGVFTKSAYIFPKNVLSRLHFMLELRFKLAQGIKIARYSKRAQIASFL